MSTKTWDGIQEIIDELHRSAARNLALAEDPRYKRTVAGSRICKERAEADLIAARHLIDMEA